MDEGPEDRRCRWGTGWEREATTGRATSSGAWPWCPKAQDGGPQLQRGQARQGSAGTGPVWHRVSEERGLALTPPPAQSVRPEAAQLGPHGETGPDEKRTSPQGQGSAPGRKGCGTGLSGPLPGNQPVTTAESRLSRLEPCSHPDCVQTQSSRHQGAPTVPVGLCSSTRFLRPPQSQLLS